MTFILIGIHVFVCLFLIFVVLLQSAQAADLAGAFGGGGSQTALGMRGATTLLQKATTVAAVVFMLTSLALGMGGRRQQGSLIEGLDAPAASGPVEAGAPTDADDTAAQQATGEQSADEGEAAAAGTEQQGEQQQQ